MTAIEKKIGFVGCGNMAEAIIRGVLEAEVCTASQIRGSDVRAERREYVREHYGIGVCATNGECVQESDVVLLAVKPRNMDAVLGEIGNGFFDGKLLLSIAAGIPIARIEKTLPEGTAVIRVMPNTPALVGKGVSVWARGSYAEDDDVACCKLLLGVLGREYEVSEEMMNAVTALSGSGPAYVLYLIEALAAAGAALGISEQLASELGVQTVIGAGCLAEASGESPTELRRKVTSPGGTTEAAMRVLEERGVKEAIGEAVTAACRRAGELSGE